MLKTLLLVVAGSYFAIAVVVWSIQERLLFFPQPVFGRPAPPPGWTQEEVRLPVGDGVVIAGLLLKPPHAVRSPLVVYFGGNAEEVTGAASQAERWGPRALLLVNYRGYGASTGEPSERALLDDALALYDWAAQRPDVDPARIAVHGRSLGTGIATQLAAARPVKAVVLTSPFTSIRDLGRRHYPWLPVGLMLRHPFDAAAAAPKVKVPALVISGGTDTIIPAEYSERLAAAWGGGVERLLLPDRGHNDLEGDAHYATAIAAFLDRHL